MQPSSNLQATASPDTAAVVDSAIPAVDAGRCTYEPAVKRDVSALLNPRPLALIGASDGNETDFATIAWITPVSHEPAMIAFALREKSRTMQLVRNAGWCSASVLDASDPASLEIATFCGNTTGHRENKAARVPHRFVAGDGAHAVPVIENALSWLICEIEDVRPVGDHLLATAFVRDARTRCPRDERQRVISLDALLCVQHDLFAQAELR